MSSRQFEHLQESSLKRLQERVPAACPLRVWRVVGGFQVAPVDGQDGLAGRFQVVAAWIDGYVTAWTSGADSASGSGRQDR